MAVAGTRSILLLCGLFSLVGASCASAPPTSTARIFGTIAACSPAPSEVSDFFYSPGFFELGDGESLSDVSVRVESATGYEGNLEVVIASLDEVQPGSGIAYDESLGLLDLPSTVDGPGVALLILIVEQFPRADEIVIRDVEFTLNEQQFVSAEEDIFELKIAESACQSE